MERRSLATDKKGAQEQGAQLVFIDESGFSLRPSVRRTWAPRGQTPLIRRHFNWKRLSAIAALLCQPDGSLPQLLLAVQEDNFTGPTILSFLEGLGQQTQGPLVLLWDGLPAHRSRLVRDYLAQNSHWLQVERFPAYAPELNPVEYLWSCTKGKDMANLCPDTLEQVQTALERAGERIGNDVSLLGGLLQASSLFDQGDTLIN